MFASCSQATRNASLCFLPTFTSRICKKALKYGGFVTYIFQQFVKQRNTHALPKIDLVIYSRFLYEGEAELVEFSVDVHSDNLERSFWVLTSLKIKDGQIQKP